MSADPRIAAVERALEDRGFCGASVEVEGHEREIAAVRVPDAAWERMLGPDGAVVAAAVKRAGFRYVALDLAPADEDLRDDAETQG